MEVRKAWERGYAGGPGTFPHVSDVKTVEIPKVNVGVLGLRTARKTKVPGNIPHVSS